MWHKYLLVPSEKSITACLSGDLKTEQFGPYHLLLVHCSLPTLPYLEQIILILALVVSWLTSTCCSMISVSAIMYVILHSSCVKGAFWLCYTGFHMTVIAHLNSPLPSVWGLRHYGAGIRCLCKKFLCFFFYYAKGCLFSSWNRKKLESVYDEQILTKRFWNPGKHINPTDLPYFLPLCSWLLFLWFFTFCSGLQIKPTVSSAYLFWVGVKGLLPHKLACFSFLCLDSYVCTF